MQLKECLRRHGLTACPASGKDSALMTDGPSTTTPCPICSRKAVERHHPFCSERCQKLDLAHWLGELYRLPSEDSAPVEEAGGEDEAP